MEKKKLLVGLRRHGCRNIDAIREKYLPHRTCTEMNMFLARLKTRERTQPHVPKVKVPIELWSEVAEQLTSGVAEYSTALGDVMEKIGRNEIHDTKINREDPDWFLIYNYVVSLLKAEELPELGQIEAGVLLDLLESLARHLPTLDVRNQRRLAAAKYNLLSMKVDVKDKKRVCELALQALESDLLQTNGTNATAASTSSGDVSPGGTCSASHTTSSADPTPSTSAKTDSSCPATEAADDGERSETYLVKPLQGLLYSINPFCIPIKYLGLLQQTSSHN